MSRPPTGDDAALVERTTEGDRKAFAALIERNRNPVFRFAMHYTGDADEALDITQETFASAFLAIARYDRERPFRTWLMRIAINKCHDWSRRRTVRSFFSTALPIEHAADVAADTAPPDEATAHRIELARVSAAITRLSASLRDVLILRTVDGLSQADTALILQLSEKAVENKLRRARQQLVDILADS